MLQLSKLQLTELNSEELAGLMLALPVNHPLFFNVSVEVERRRIEAFNKMPDDEKEEFMKSVEMRIEANFPLIDALARSSNQEMAESIISQLSEKRGRLN